MLSEDSRRAVRPLTGRVPDGANNTLFWLKGRDLARILGLAFVILAVAAAGTLAVGFIYRDLKAVTASAIVLVVLPLLSLFLKKGRFAAAAAGLVFLLLGIALYVVVLGAGLHDPGMVVFSLVIVAAGLLLQRRMALFMMAATVAVVVCLGVLQLSGNLRAGERHPISSDDIFHAGLLLLAMAGLVWLLTDNLWRSLTQVFIEQRKYNQIFEATNDAIMVLDPDGGTVVEANRAAHRLLERMDLVGADAASLANLPAPFDLRDARGWIAKASEQEPQLFDWQWRAADGGVRFFQIALQRAAIGDRERVLAVIRDTTVPRAIEARLREGDKLRAVGQLAGGIAHDFNNQLTGILASVSCLQESAKLDKESQSMLNIVEKSARRSADLTRQLLAFARKAKQKHDRVDCGQLVSEVVALLERSLDKRIVIKTDIGAGCGTTEGDPSLLQNALLNLGLNARDAMPDGGVLTFACKGVVAGPDAGVPPGLSDRGYVRLVVKDTGIGMNDEVKAHLFEPFFTTKPDGNGMGLAAVYGTVQSHGGAVTVDSTPGRGTTFSLFLPMADAASGPHRESAQESVRPVLRGLRVLVAEDEPAVSRAALALLEHLGCRPVLVQTGEEALACLETRAADFDVVLLDNDMPGRSGAEVLSSLGSRRLPLPVVLTSGYARDGIVAHLPAGVTFLPKPYGIDDLARALAVGGRSAR